MEIKYVKYYKLLVRISSPTYFSVFTIFKETTQRNLYLCKFLLSLSI